MRCCCGDDAGAYIEAQPGTSLQHKQISISFCKACRDVGLVVGLLADETWSHLALTTLHTVSLRNRYQCSQSLSLALSQSIACSYARAQALVFALGDCLLLFAAPAELGRKSRYKSNVFTGAASPWRRFALAPNLDLHAARLW